MFSCSFFCNQFPLDRDCNNNFLQQRFNSELQIAIRRCRLLRGTVGRTRGGHSAPRAARPTGPQELGDHDCQRLRDRGGHLSDAPVSRHAGISPLEAQGRLHLFGRHERIRFEVMRLFATIIILYEHLEICLNLIDCLPNSLTLCGFMKYQYIIYNVVTLYAHCVHVYCAYFSRLLKEYNL